MCTLHHDLITAKGKETRHADNIFTTDIIELELSEILSIPGIFKMMHYGILFNMPYSECHTIIYNKPSDAPDENGLLDMRSNTPPLISSVFNSSSSVGSIDINFGILSVSMASTVSMSDVSKALN